MIQTTAALVVFLFPLAYSPGPGNMFFAANGARFGFRATVPANLGYHLATWIVTAGIGSGFIAAFEMYPQGVVAIRIAGALYMLWIAWRLIGAGKPEGDGAARCAVFSNGSVSFTDGIVLLVLNPKAFVIIVPMFTQFLGRSATPDPGQVALITTVFTFNNLIAFVFWILVGDTLGRQFRTPASARLLNLAFGAILAAVAVWMLIS